MRLTRGRGTVLLFLPGGRAGMCAAWPDGASPQKYTHSRSLLPYSRSLLTLVWSTQAVVINTYLSLFSSCVVSMIFSSLYSGQFKLDPVPTSPP